MFWKNKQNEFEAKFDKLAYRISELEKENAKLKYIGKVATHIVCGMKFEFKISHVDTDIKGNIYIDSSYPYLGLGYRLDSCAISDDFSTPKINPLMEQFNKCNQIIIEAIKQQEKAKNLNSDLKKKVVRKTPIKKKTKK